MPEHEADGAGMLPLHISRTTVISTLYIFAVMKRRGFNLEDTHMTDPERVSRLVAVLTLALCWGYKVGVSEVKTL